jgi:prepilin-type N-terminal cleavage/methylation domain-containing protein
MFYKKYPRLRLKYVCGFSLTEVLITAAIIGIVTVIVVVKYSAFNSSVLLKNHAYEIALTIRQAQVYSVSTRGEESNFRDGYGVYVNPDVDGKAQSLTLFLDTNVAGGGVLYDVDDTIIEVLSLDSRFEIVDVCVTISSTLECSSTGAIGDWSMVFRRPIFDPNYFAGGASDQDAIESASIIIAPVQGGSITRTIEVGPTGQISVKGL